MKTMQRAFTLLELLIVVGLIGILISVGTVAYTAAQKKSRDSRRKSDLKAVQNALEQYYADNLNKYGTSFNPGTGYLPGGIPNDPKTGIAYNTTYGATITDTSYCLCTALESETNTLNDCGGGAVPSGYRGLFCVRNLQ